MRYIKKLPTPDFFIEDTKELQKKIVESEIKSKVWDDDYTKKRELKEYILENEQNWLCGYCEAKVNLNNTHVEHVKPKSLDYNNLTFDYQNLIISCQGDCFNKLDDRKPKNCGHKKGEKYDESYFLNPIIEKNIREYFIYTNNGYIKASKLDRDKSIYTIELLQLNTFGNGLSEARKLSLKNFISKIKNRRGIITREEFIRYSLSNDNIPFISFLRYVYRKINS